MPIKFRCTHCRQFLGISHSKAGCIVDCPTCGRSVRVPERDGQAEPVPDPRLNFDDSVLSNALDELAMIGREKQVEKSPPDGKDDSKQVKELPPAPVPEPIEVEAPLPAEPVIHHPPSSSSRNQAGSSSSVQTGVAATLTPQEEQKPISEQEEEEAEEQIVPSAMPLPQQEPLWKSRTRRRSDRDGAWTFAMIAGAILLAAGAGGFGYMIGSNSGEAEPNDTENVPQNEAAGKPDLGNDSNPTRKTSLKGGITYKTIDGTSRPDEKARVILFPRSREGDVQLSVVGFRAADSATDFRVINAAFRELGGDAAIVDENGEFEISVSEAGAYHILVLSNHTRREDDAAIPSVLRDLLAQYFDRPDSLMGQVRFFFGEVWCPEDKTETWYYSFDQG